MPRTSSCRISPDVVAADRDPAGLGVEEAEEEVHDGRLASTALADERDAAAGLDPEVEVLEHSGPSP